MSTLLNFAVDREGLFYEYKELYPTERIDLFAKVGSLRSNQPGDHRPTKQVGQTHIFDTFFCRFSSGAYHIL